MLLIFGRSQDKLRQIDIARVEVDTSAPARPLGDGKDLLYGIRVTLDIGKYFQGNEAFKAPKHAPQLPAHFALVVAGGLKGERLGLEVDPPICCLKLPAYRLDGRCVRKNEPHDQFCRWRFDRTAHSK